MQLRVDRVESPFGPLTSRAKPLPSRVRMRFARTDESLEYAYHLDSFAQCASSTRKDNRITHRKYGVMHALCGNSGNSAEAKALPVRRGRPGAYGSPSNWSPSRSISLGILPSPSMPSRPVTGRRLGAGLVSKLQRLSRFRISIKIETTRIGSRHGFKPLRF